VGVWLSNGKAMVLVASCWRAGFWGQCCRVEAEVREVVGRIGCVAMMVVGNGRCY
jgi:hypothetical protein